jgi:competence protein ComFB
MQLVNYMEGAVKRCLDELLEDSAYKDFQPDERTKLDVLALALNHLPARYVVTEKGYIFTRVDELKHQFKTDIIVELSKAILQVRTHPR